MDISFRMSILYNKVVCAIKSTGFISSRSFASIGFGLGGGGCVNGAMRLMFACENYNKSCLSLSGVIIARATNNNNRDNNAPALISVVRGFSSGPVSEK